jgi:hypothetical protein
MSGRILVVAAVVFSLGAAEEPKKQPLTARQTAADFLDAALNGRLKEAAAMGQPGQAPSREASLAFFKDLNIRALPLVSVHADDAHALVITEHVNADHGRKGPLVLTLVKQDNKWWIRDTDVETDASANDELKRFLGKYPNAKPMLAE